MNDLLAFLFAWGVGGVAAVIGVYILARVASMAYFKTLRDFHQPKGQRHEHQNQPRTR